MTASVWAGGADITVPGVCQHLPLTGPVTEVEAFAAAGVVSPEADLIIGETLAHGVIRLRGPASWFDQISAHAARCAALIRSQEPS